MTEYYVDPDTGNDTTGDGSSGTPWATIQKAEDSTGAGDIIYLLHGSGSDETPSACIDFDGTAGNQTSGWKQFIGVGAGWADDGTRYVIGGGSISSNAIFNFNQARNYYYYFKNIELLDATTDAMKTSANYPVMLIFDNCCFNNPASSGLDTYMKTSLFYRCRFESCGGYGFYRPWVVAILFCTFIDNTSNGLAIYHGGSLVYGNVFHNNAVGYNDEFGELLNNAYCINNVFDGNSSDGIDISASAQATGFHIFLGNRCTNNGGFGLDDNNDGYLATELYNFFLSNTSGAIDGTKRTPLSGRGSLSTGTEGYVDKANHDFNLTDSATLRRTAITLP